MKRISVCMATYNGERFIEEQVNSIITQLGEEDELIISDDGSYDETVSIINRFSDSRIQLLINRDRKSVTRNFENALNHAEGDIIFLSDQDDIWYSNKVQTMLLSLQKHDLVVSNCDFIDESGRLMERSFFDDFRSGSGFVKNFIKNTFLGNCMAFRRSVLERALPFPEELHKATEYLIYQDVWIGLLANALFDVTFIPNKLSGFRRHAANTSPTEMGVKSPQSLSRKIHGRSLLSLALLKRIGSIG